jgi:hypothetical protein
MPIFDAIGAYSFNFFLIALKPHPIILQYICGLKPAPIIGEQISHAKDLPREPVSGFFGVTENVGQNNFY